MSYANIRERAPGEQAYLFGHPTGLYTLFFAEMWERFSYYGMRALLVLYMIKGYLGYGDSQAYSVYGAYTALVYMTPFFGGMLADRVLGARVAVIIGGTMMALGHLLMTWENPIVFFLALACLIVGNGFFKPNISAIVGSLYKGDTARRDGGFTIFYIGINLGAAMSPLLCGYVGETYGWHYGFGLATVGMLIGLAIFAAPTRVAQALIALGAATAAFGLLYFRPDSPIMIATNLFIAVALITSALISIRALGLGGIPADVGLRPTPGIRGDGTQGRPIADWKIYAGILIAIPVFALLVSGFGPLNQGKMVQVIPESTLESIRQNPSALVSGVATILEEISKPAGLVLFITGMLALAYLLKETFSFDLVARHRMFVVLILTFFSLLFWAIFEQAGSSVNNFTDRNVNRVVAGQIVTDADVGQTIELQPTQQQLGFARDGRIFTLDQLDALRQENKDNPAFSISWKIDESHRGMRISERANELPASTFQAVNPIYILLFGLVLSTAWTFLGKRGWEPSTPVKFSLGLVLLGCGFGAFWMGAQASDQRGMVSVEWLLLGYLVQTLGELCLSPVGLSMVTKLSPATLVSTVMGAWFLATAFSQYLAGIISQFTRIDEPTGGIPEPLRTVNVYGDVFGIIALMGIASGLTCLALSPLLRRWMHEEVAIPGDEANHDASSHA
jgi:POT family proton-dependent oligopeptide transporter